MTVPVVRQTAPWPARRNAQANFDQMADAVAATLPLTIDDLNEAVPFVNQRALAADASAQAAAASQQAAEADRAAVAANTETVAANTATVVARADEAAANAQQVAADAQQVAVDAQAVAAAIEAIADGPVPSVNGKTGIVTLDAADVGAITLAQAHATALCF